MTALLSRTRRLTASAVIACTAVVWTASAPVAGAHEVRVVVAIAAATEPTPAGRSTGLDGLQLGIDQSPDVGHAPGPDAGDHLGGVDVELVVTSPGSRIDDLVADGAEIVVVLDPTEVSAVGRQLAGRSTLLVAVLANETAIPEIRPDRMVLLRSIPRGEASTTAADFETAFIAAHQRAPSDRDALGYDVSQLLDVVLAKIDGEVLEVRSGSTFWSEAQARLISSRMEVAFVFEGSSADRPESTPDSRDGQSTLFEPLDAGRHRRGGGASGDCRGGGATAPRRCAGVGQLRQRVASTSEGRS